MDWTHNLKLFEESIMARQQKQAVAVHKIANPRFGYVGQWTVSASPTTKTPNPDPYVVSHAKDGNWSCSCMQSTGRVFRDS